MVAIPDHRSLVLTVDVLREWLSAETTPERAQEIAHDAALPEKDFSWHPVKTKVGNIHNQGPNLKEEIKAK
ncbi:hypothetical protein [Pantoea agglomerans]|uniref:hypothetical protein n=1 Tax=Enterobacter agglomerans TaxID=549 RepID=UPI00301771FE